MKGDGCRIIAVTEVFVQRPQALARNSQHLLMMCTTQLQIVFDCDMHHASYVMFIWALYSLAVGLAQVVLMSMCTTHVCAWVSRLSNQQTQWC